MISHCKSELPLEGCGLLSGPALGYGNNCWKMRNLDASPISFSIDDQELRNTFLEMERKGEKLTGIFHSHPTSRAYPSHQDIKYAHYPAAIYIIVSFAKKGPEVKGYKIKNGKVIPVQLIKY